MLPRSLGILVALVFLFGFSHQIRAENANCYRPDASWNNLASDCYVYAELLEAPPLIHTDPSCSLESGLENRQRFGASMTVSARHEMLDRGGNVRLRTVSANCAELVPNRRNQYAGTGQAAYIRTEYLRLLQPSEFEPILLPGEVIHSPERLIVVNRADNSVTALYGSRVDGRFMNRMGPTPIGDHRSYRASVAIDMLGFNAVPWGFSMGGGYYLHGAPWWAWDEIARGSGGSHGCVNLPGNDWFTLQVGKQRIGVAQWLWRWNAANLAFDPTTQDPEAWFVEIFSDQRWYQVIDSVRVIVVNNLNDLYNYPLTNRMGEMASTASVTNWSEVIQSIQAVGDNWLLTHQDESGHTWVELIAAGVSIAQLEGRQGDSPYVMLACDQVERYGEPAYPGSSRTVGAVCRHLRVERGGSICTPERIDFAYLGKKTLCDGPRFDASTLEIRGELIEHENVHLAQFSGYFGTLVRRGIASDDLSRGIDWRQISLIGVTELMAQMMNVGSPLDEDYKFVLTRPDANGQLVLVSNSASTLEAWRHLQAECGDSTGLDVELASLLTSGLFGDAQAYRQLSEICSAPPHRLVPDRWR